MSPGTIATVRDVCAQLDWKSKRERLEALGAITELRRILPDVELTVERCDETAPGSAWLTWRLPAVAETDQFQRRLALTLNEIGWGRTRTAITQFDA